MSINTLIKKTLSLLMSITVATNSNAANNPQSTSMPMMGEIKGMERCFGISKAHLNDCSTALHDCSGLAQLDRSKTEWILLPTGLCNKIVGGSTVSPDEKHSQQKKG